jgi:hypothetical protein
MWERLGHGGANAGRNVRTWSIGTVGVCSNTKPSSILELLTDYAGALALHIHTTIASKNLWQVRWNDFFAINMRWQYKRSSADQASPPH